MAKATATENPSNTSAPAAEGTSAPAAAEETTTRPKIPVPTYNNLAGLSAALSSHIAATGNLSARMFTKGGFKDVGGLDSLQPTALGLMAVECIHAMLSKPDGDKVLAIVNEWIVSAPDQIRQLRNLESYQRLAEGLGISQNAGETPEAFIKRVLRAAQAANA